MAQREDLIREVEDRIERGDLPERDDWDDDALAILVRKLGPKGPPGKFGMAVTPDTEPENRSDEGWSGSRLPRA